MIRILTKSVWFLSGLVIILLVFIVFCCFFDTSEEVTHTSEETTQKPQDPIYQEVLNSATGLNLSNADLAWHAVNTYKWDCSEVVTRGSITNSGYYPITCSNGKKLRVYEREGMHPKITKSSGRYE